MKAWCTDHIKSGYTGTSAISFHKEPASVPELDVKLRGLVSDVLAVKKSQYRIDTQAMERVPRITLSCSQCWRLNLAWMRAETSADINGKYPGRL